MAYERPWFEVEAGYGGAIALMVLPEDMAQHIVEWSDKNIDDGEVYGQAGKGRDRSPHVTVQNGIMGADIQELEKLFSQAGPVEIELGPVSVFRDPKKDYDVVHIPIISDQLHGLNGMIGELLEVNNPHTDYQPHITLAYVKKDRGARFDGLKDFEGAKTTLYDAVIDGKGMDAKKFSLKSEEGPQGGPLKDSVDYPESLLMFASQDLEDYLLTNGKSVRDFSASELKNLVIQMRKGF